MLALDSSGVHSNGYSLVRRLVQTLGLRYEDPCPFQPDTTLGAALLTPTCIYTKALMPVLKANLVKALAHITGGGLLENIPRVLPEDCGVSLDAQVRNATWLGSARSEGKGGSAWRGLGGSSCGCVTLGLGVLVCCCRG